jgi:hypothetical protein
VLAHLGDAHIPDGIVADPPPVPRTVELIGPLAARPGQADRRRKPRRAGHARGCEAAALVPAEAVQRVVTAARRVPFGVVEMATAFGVQVPFEPPVER